MNNSTPKIKLINCEVPINEPIKIRKRGDRYGYERIKPEVESIPKEEYSQALNDIKEIVSRLRLTDEQYANHTTISETELRRGFELCKKTILEIIGNV